MVYNQNIPFFIEKYLLRRINMFTQLSKKEAKKLETTSTRIENLHNKMGCIKYVKCLNQLGLLLSWYNTQGISINDSQKKQNDKLSELFGCKPSYYITYSERNAAWGFQFGDNINNKFLVHHSQRGMSFQVSKNFNVNEIENLLDFISSLLVNYNNIPEMMKFLVEE